MVLANSDKHPSVFHYSDNIRQLEALAAAGCISEETSLRLQEIYRTYRLRLHHLILDEQEPLLARHDFSDERCFVNAMWRRCLGDDVA